MLRSIINALVYLVIIALLALEVPLLVLVVLCFVMFVANATLASGAVFGGLEDMDEY
jgi:hypothetical protein